MSIPRILATVALLTLGTDLPAFAQLRYRNRVPTPSITPMLMC